MFTSEFDNYAEKYKDAISLINSLDNWAYTRHLPNVRDKVLDIGCGSGLLLHTLSKYFNHCYGIDISQEMIHHAKQSYPNLELLCGDANTLPYPNKYFDMVVSHTTFHHLNVSKALKDVRRVLKPGGTAVIVDVIKGDMGISEKIKRFLLRDLYSKIKLVCMYGPASANECWRYLSGPEWREHRKQDKLTELSRKQTEQVYNETLKGCKVLTVNFHIVGIVWKKPNNTI